MTLIDSYRLVSRLQMEIITKRTACTVHINYSEMSLLYIM